MSVRRPDYRLLIVTAAAMAQFSITFNDLIFMPICWLILLCSYQHKFYFVRPDLTKPKEIIVALLAALTITVGYYQIFLHQTGNLVIPISGLMIALAIVWQWHRERAYLDPQLFVILNIAIVIISIVYLNQPPPYYHLVSTFFLLAVIFTLACVTPPSIAKDAIKRPVATRYFTMLISIAAVGLNTFVVIGCIGIFEKDMFSAIENNLFKLPIYAESMGSVGDIAISRQSNFNGGDEVVAAISGAQSPDYLRVQVLTRYQDGIWSSLISSQSAQKITPTLIDEHGAKQFLFNESRPQVLIKREIILYENLRGGVPLPYRTVAIETADDVSFSIAEGATLHCDKGNGLSKYQAVIAGAPQQPENSAAVEIAAASEIPLELQASLMPLTKKIVKDQIADTGRAALLVQNYFRENYQYSLQVKLANEGDPIADFVLNRKPAYCKYFAAGMVLMLRSIGIPARIASGFVGKEFNQIANVWMIRQRDAHVWCEVYDHEHNRWLIYDPTPPAVIAPMATVSLLARIKQQWEWLKLIIKRAILNIEIAGIQSSLANLSQQLMAWLRRPINSLTISILLLIFIFLKLRKRAKKMLPQLWRKLTLSLPRQDRLAQKPGAQSEFERVSVLLQKNQLPIGPAETVEEYLIRLKAQQLIKAQPELIELLENFFQSYNRLSFSIKDDHANAQLAALNHQAGQIADKLNLPQ